MVTVIAHRGWSGLFPENTLLAFQEAARLGVPAIELDVQATAEGHLVVIHDVMVDRTTNGHGAVRELTLDQIRHLDAGQGEHIPTIEEIFSLFATKIALQVEVKGAGLEQSLARLWKKHGARSDVYFTSFDRGILARMKAVAPQVPVAPLDPTTFIRPGFHDGFATKLVQQARDLGAFAIHLNYSVISTPIVNVIHGAGLLLHAWGVTREVTPAQIQESGVDGFTTNWPDQYQELFTTTKN